MSKTMLFIGKVAYSMYDTKTIKFMLFTLLLIPFAAFAINENQNTPHLVNRYINVSVPKQYYSVQIHYPKIQGGNLSSSNKQFNQLIYRFINKTKSKFINDAVDGMTSLKAELPLASSSLNTNSNYLFIQYKIYDSPNKIISVRFTVSTYFYGAAHQNTYTFSMNYNTSTKKLISLASLFIPNSDYLGKISIFCKKQLISQLKADDQASIKWIKEGAAATKVNYSTWNITNKGILFSFDPYQVAPYVDGIQEVLY